MNILLVNPPNCGRSIPEERYGLTSIKQIFRGEPLALEALAGNLVGHEVRIVDLKAEPAGLEAAANGFRPQLVGITAVTCEANTALRLAGEARDAWGARVAVGGIHASNDPAFFNRPEVDFVAVGLGKASFAELVADLEAGGAGAAIPGIARTRPGDPLELPPRRLGPADLVEDRPPRYDLVAPYRPQYVLRALGAQVGFVSAAFGCPHACAFCCIAGLTGGRYLPCGIDAIVRDIRLLREVPVVRLVDANTFGAPEHARRLARALREAALGKQFIGDVRADTVVRHPDLLAEWRAAGLRAVVVGFEEVSDEGLARLGKAGDVATYGEAVKILHGLGVTVVGDFIVSPAYREADFERLGRAIEDLGVDLPILSVLTPLPGTPLYAAKKHSIAVHDLDYYTLTNAVLPTALDEETFYRRYAELTVAGHARARL